MEVYPAASRKAYFAFRFTRLMAKTCVAQEIGANACWLLATISMQEDACRYRRAVTFYDHQLAPLMGCSPNTLGALRKKCVDAGWLHYIHGGKGKPGKYWVLVPSHADGLSDGTVDEGEMLPKNCDANQSETNQNSIANQSQPGCNQDATRMQPGCNRSPSYPIPKETVPSPAPSPAESGQAGNDEPVTEKELSETPTDGPINWPVEFAKFAAHWQATKSGQNGIAPFVGLPSPETDNSEQSYVIGWGAYLTQIDREAFKSFWPTKKDLALQALKAINEGAIQWGRAAMSLNVFANEMNGIVAGTHKRDKNAGYSRKPTRTDEVLEDSRVFNEYLNSNQGMLTVTTNNQKQRRLS